jgi:HK97 gp10 family phage protein|tara:strand:+ start:401 stop:787 length:387 start_codon:yes stop_codon:yes gene_type:complete
MAMEFDVKVEYKANPKIFQVEERLSAALEIAARHIEAKAKEDVPVDTGATKGSINAKPGATASLSVFAQAISNVTGTLSWRIGPTTEYAPFLEFGTRRMAARPYMVPAIESERPKLVRAVKQLMSEIS